MQGLRMAHALCVKIFRCVHSAIEDGEEGLWHVRSPATHMGQGQVLFQRHALPRCVRGGGCAYEAMWLETVLQGAELY